MFFCTPGHNQRRLFRGFSSVNDICSCKARSKTRHEKRISRFPWVTFSWSPGLKSGSPRGCWSDRSLGGPPGRSRAREKLWQGVPKWPARTSPDIIQCMILFWLLESNKSYIAPKLISHKRTGHPHLRCIALPKRPHPLKISRKTETLRLRVGSKAFQTRLARRPFLLARPCLLLLCWDCQRAAPVLNPSRNSWHFSTSAIALCSVSMPVCAASRLPRSLHLRGATCMREAFPAAWGPEAPSCFPWTASRPPGWL